MSLKRRIIFILFLALFVIAAFLTLGYFSLRRSVPAATGHFPAPGLSQTTEIGWDQWGIPHIRARSEIDLFFAQGYVTAQDRLWQMDLMRRAAQGRLAELFGEEMLPIDIFARTIAFERLGGRLLTVMPRENFSYLQAYCAGINAYIRSSKRLPLEFSVLNYEPEPWKPDDCLAAQRLIAWLLSMGWHVDLVYGELLHRVDSVKFARISPQALPQPDAPYSPRLPAASSKPTAPLSSPMPAARANANLIDGEAALRTLLNTPLSGLGSNAWAVNSRHTRLAGALLANDTHLPFTAPSIYYLCHLQSPGINAAGAGIPGLPGLVVGRNESIAWGVTHGMIDDADFLPLKPDTLDADHYLFRGQRLAYTWYDETIRIKDRSPHKMRVAWTHAGPVVSAQTPLLEISRPHPLILRWTGFNLDDPVSAWQKILMSRDWYEFVEALKNCKSPGENFIYADAQGRIGLQLAAEVPLRNFPNACWPPPDTLQQADWIGSVPYEQLPRIFQPGTGRIINANQCLADSTYPFHLSAYWEPDYRYRRIQQLLDTLRVADVAAFTSMQNDVYSAHAAWFVPLLLRVITPLALAQNSPADFGRALLSVWDYHQSANSVASTLYEATYGELMRRTFADEMGDDLFRRFLDMPHFNISTLDRLIARNDSAWFDDVRTGKVETLDTLMIASFHSAIDDLSNRFGENMGVWNWGDLHTLTQSHPLGTHAPFRRYLNIGPHPSAGSHFTINNGTWLLSQPYANFVGPCVRHIADMATQEYHIILPAGQSGHPFSPHYADQTPMWQQGKMITLNLRSLNTRNSDWKWQTLHPGGR